MRKKGDLSINVIIVAILALLVLVILSVMFISKMSAVGDNIDSCEAKGAICRAGSCNDGETRLPFVECSTGGEVCCAGSNTAQDSGSGDSGSVI